MIYALDSGMPRWARFVLDGPVTFRGFLEEIGVAQPADLSYFLAETFQDHQPELAMELGFELHRSRAVYNIEDLSEYALCGRTIAQFQGGSLLGAEMDLW